MPAIEMNSLRSYVTQLCYCVTVFRFVICRAFQNNFCWKFTITKSSHAMSSTDRRKYPMVVLLLHCKLETMYNRLDNLTGGRRRCAVHRPKEFTKFRPWKLLNVGLFILPHCQRGKSKIRCEIRRPVTQRRFYFSLTSVSNISRANSADSLKSPLPVCRFGQFSLPPQRSYFFGPPGTFLLILFFN